jgi:hypothetical protein
LKVDRAAQKARTDRWMQHYQTLPASQRGLIMLALLVNAQITLLLQLTLTVTGIRAAHRAWRARRLGLTRAAQSALSPALACAATAYVLHDLARRWLLRMADNGRAQPWLEHADRWLRSRADPNDPPVH